MSKGVCAISVSPAIDRTIYINNFTPNSVNRVIKSFDTPGSKGVNVALNLARCKIKSTCIGFIGGSGADFVKYSLQANGVICDFVPVTYDVRTNLKIVDLEKSTYTDINYPCGEPTSKDISLLKQKIKLLARENRYIALSGNISQNYFLLYSELCDIIKKEGAKVTVDCTGNALYAAVKQKPYIIKPNLKEFNETFNTNCKTKEDIKNAALRLCDEGIENVLVSLDKDGAVAVCNQKSYFVSVCDVPVLNTVGAGDAFLSGFIYAKMLNSDIVLCLKYASSFAQATVSHMANEKKTIDEYEKYIPNICVEEF